MGLLRLWCHEYQPFEPSCCPLHMLMLLPILCTPSPAQRLGVLAWVTGHTQVEAVQEISKGPFEPSSSTVCHSQVALDPPQPHDWASRRPWSGLRGCAPIKVVKEKSSNHFRGRAHSTLQRGGGEGFCLCVQHFINCHVTYVVRLAYKGGGGQKVPKFCNVLCARPLIAVESSASTIVGLQ